MATVQGQYKGQNILAGDDAYIASQMKAIDSASAPKPTVQPSTVAPSPQAPATQQSGQLGTQAYSQQLLQQSQALLPKDSQPVQQQQSQQSQQTQTTQQTQQQGSLAMPANGSVVDLLNMAGQDSSYAAREQMAKQYGIQGYTGTGNQNTELGKKFLEAFNANKGSKAPQSGAEGKMALDNFFGSQEVDSTKDSDKKFFDIKGSMNPIEASIFDGLAQAFSAVNTQKSLREEIMALPEFAERQGLQTELLDMKRIMEGTEDDIREEVQSTGGLATNSQIMALAGARNKSLLKQSNNLIDQLTVLDDYIDQVTTLTKADRDQLQKDFDNKLGLGKTMFDMAERMDSAAKENYQNIVEVGGYQGLSDAFIGHPAERAFAEKSLGLPPGALSNQRWLEAMTNSELSFKDLPSIAQEYEYAVSNGYDGTFSQYQNEDANRKKSITINNSGGLTPGQVNTTVNTIANAFDNEPLVKEYNTIKRNLEIFNGLGASAPDDMLRVYTFAKVADPNSAVREAEYDSVEKYSQAVIQRAGLKVSRVFTPTGVLTQEARDAMSKTLNGALAASYELYKKTESEYQRQIDDAYAGKPRQITSYGEDVAVLAAQKGISLERVRAETDLTEAEIYKYLLEL